jgi:transcriptional regulator with XRE-family HTH domain
MEGDLWAPASGRNPSGQELLGWRARHGLSRAQLAELLCFANPKAGGRVTIAKWEGEKQAPAPYLWLALENLELYLSKRAHGRAPRLGVLG